MKKLIIFLSFLLFVNLISSTDFSYNYLDTTTIGSSTISYSGNLTNFTELFDTPSSYSGEGGKCVKVNVGESALVFGDCATGSGTGDFSFNDFQSSFNSNFTEKYNLYNDDWLSTYNSTYALWSYNQTTATYNLYNPIWSSTYNATYALWAYNQTKLYYAGSPYLYLTSDTFYFNDSEFSVQYYNATTLNVISGTVQGTIVETQHKNAEYDGISLNLTEQASANALDIMINFTDGITKFSEGVIRYKTSNIVGDLPVIQLWNFETLEWESYGQIVETPEFLSINRGVYDYAEHVQNGTVRMRLFKSGTGNTNNHYYIDWLAISRGFGTPIGEEVDPYSIHKDGSSTITSNISFNPYDVIASKFYGKFNFSVSFPSNYVIGSFDGSNIIINFNESKLNTTIDNKISGLTGSSYNATYDLWAYNQTIATYNLYNPIWSSTYNATYNLWSYNQSTPVFNYISSNENSWLSTYNATYASSLGTNWTLQTYNTYNPIWSSTYNSTYAASLGVNWTLQTYNTYNPIWSSTYNSTYALWSYNQTTATFNLYNSTWDNSFMNKWNYNQTTATYNLYNNVWSSTYNSSYLVKTGDTMTGNLTINDCILFASGGKICSGI